MARDQRQVAENIREIVSFLRSPPPKFTRDDAAATCSPGYSMGVDVSHNPRDKQPMGYEELIRWGVIDRPTTRLPERDDAPSPRESPRWEHDVARHVDKARQRWETRWPLYIRVGVPRALSLIQRRDQVKGTQDRELVHLVAELWLTFRAAGELLRPPLAHSTVFDRYQVIMQEIEALVFDDDGAGRGV